MYKNSEVATHIGTLPAYFRKARIDNANLQSEITSYAEKLAGFCEDFEKRKASISLDPHLSPQGKAVELNAARKQFLSDFDTHRDSAMLELEHRTKVVRRSMKGPGQRFKEDSLLDFMVAKDLRDQIASHHPTIEQRERLVAEIAKTGKFDQALDAIIAGPRGFRLVSDEAIEEAVEQRLQRLNPEKADQIRQLSEAHRIAGRTAEIIRAEIAA